MIQISCPVPSSVAIVAEPQRQVLDPQVGEIVLEEPAQAVAGDQPEPVMWKSSRPMTRRFVSETREFLELVELAGRIAAGNDRADRRAGDDVGDDAFALEDPHHADMRPAAGGAAAERQADLQPRAGLAFGSDLGHAFSASTVAEPERATGDPVPQHDLTSLPDGDRRTRR